MKNIQGGIGVIFVSPWRIAQNSFKHDGWKTIPFLLGWQNFRGPLLIFQEGMYKLFRARGLTNHDGFFNHLLNGMILQVEAVHPRFFTIFFHPEKLGTTGTLFLDVGKLIFGVKKMGCLKRPSKERTKKTTAVKSVMYL